jgi:hypothetical protein
MMSARSTIVSLVAVGLLTACGSKEPAPQQTRESLQACTVGTWLSKDRTCNCASVPLLTTPECGESDCLEADALVLRADATSLDLVVRRSAKQNKLSVVGAPGGVTAGTWEISPKLDLVQTFRDRTYTTGLSCEGDRLVRPSKSSYIKASSEIGNAIDGASRANWSSVAIR